MHHQGTTFSFFAVMDRSTRGWVGTRVGSLSLEWDSFVVDFLILIHDPSGLADRKDSLLKITHPLLTAGPEKVGIRRGMGPRGCVWKSFFLFWGHRSGKVGLNYTLAVYHHLTSSARNMCSVFV